jgi:hypothetical protein
MIKCTEWQRAAYQPQPQAAYPSTEILDALPAHIAIAKMAASGFSTSLALPTIRF